MKPIIECSIELIMEAISLNHHYLIEYIQKEFRCFVVAPRVSVI